ncbi:MAG: hypothetical protein GY811_06825 [Myxococcales bacterium]|nr:hypothetical protein [Myxococcales bacterium]
MSHPLSQVDSFFVAYQEASCASMQLGAEAELEGSLSAEALHQAMDRVVQRWPRLGQTLRTAALGLRWDGATDIDVMIRRDSELSEWRNGPINPFVEPPFQVLWVQSGDRHRLCFRAHHSVMDGQALLALSQVVVSLAAGAGDFGSVKVNDSDPFALVPLLRKLSTRSLLRQASALYASAKRDSRQLPLDSAEPGGIEVCQLNLGGDARAALFEYAKRNEITPANLVAASWIRALGTLESSEGRTDTHDISLEVPVSLRSRKSVSVSNGVSPILLFANPELSLLAIAKALKKQTRDAIRSRSHLSMPLLTAPGRYLPWTLFRRLAANTAFSGSASSHFTWLDIQSDTHREVEEASQHRLKIVGQLVYTPVCLHMGVALSVVNWKESLQLFVTHRTKALSRERAEALTAGLMRELGEHS